MRLISRHSIRRRVIRRAVYGRRHPYGGHSWLSLLTFGLLRRAQGNGAAKHGGS